MSEPRGETFLTVVWSLGLYGWGVAVLGLGLLGTGSDGPEALAFKSLAAMGGSYILLAVGLAMSLSSPLPEDPGGGSRPLRLWVGWGIMGLCPPPSRLLRLTSAAAASALCFYPFETVHPATLYGPASLLAAGAFLGKPKADLSLSSMDVLLIVGLSVTGFTALSLGGSAKPEDVWRVVAAFAALTALTAQRTRELCAALWTQLRPGVPPPPALDLSRYEVSAEALLPPERAALPPGVEEQLVDSGSFRVDAAKMLEKLRSFQLAEPADFVCAWLRCAAASGAKDIRLDTGARSLTLVFDGAPFSASELSQPYQVLVDGEGPDARRGRHFAYGLLGLYRLRPVGVTVTSRGEGGTAVMRAGAVPEPDAEAAPEGTVVTVVWPVWASWWRPWTVARRARARFGMGPAALSVNGDPLERILSSGEGDQTHEEEGLRWSARRVYMLAQVRLYVLGTLVETLEGEEAHELAGAVGLDDAELNISQTAVVRTSDVMKLLARIRKGLA